MPHIEKHLPGSFNWIELATTDQDAAKKFYGELLGWESQDFPMGPDGSYTMFKLDGRDIAGGFKIPAGVAMPPHWELYVAVDNADGTTARAAGLGATIIRPAFDVFNLGRMAVIQDPTGAFFSIWQAISHVGSGIAGENGTLCWADLNTPDRERAKAFYEALFGWSFDPGKDTSADPYLHIKNGETFIGGVVPEAHRNKHAPPHWLIYFQVADCDASTGKATELGGKVYVPPMSLQNNLRYSVVADPQGIVFALFQGSA